MNTSEKLGNFINSVGAARLLLQRSFDQEFLIEAVVLYAALVDSFCRIALVLKYQIENETQDFDEKYIFQDETTKNYFSEREIYKLCLDNLIINNKLFDEVEVLYEIRNKAIHRFLITEIEYSHLGMVLDQYELIYQRLWTIVYGLESEQISKGVGMTLPGSKGQDGKETKSIFFNLKKKIDSKDTNKLIRTLGSKLVRNSVEFSEKTERAVISKKINNEIEIQEKKKR